MIIPRSLRLVPFAAAIGAQQAELKIVHLDHIALLGSACIRCCHYQRSDLKEKFWWHGMDVVKLRILDHTGTTHSGNRRIGYRAARTPVGAMLDNDF